MEKRFVTGVFLLLIILILLFTGCTSTSPPEDLRETTKKVYVVGIDAEYPPFSYMDSNGEVTGFDVESMKWIANRNGFEVRFQPTTWDEIIPALETGKIDLIYSGMSITPEREEMVNFSIPYLKVNQSVVIRQTNNYTLDDFSSGKLVIGAQSGTTGAFWVIKNLIDPGKMPVDNLTLYDNFPLVVTGLATGQIDTAIYDRPAMRDAIADKPLVIIGEINTSEEYSIALRKTDPELLATINEGLTALMQDKYWETLKVKYNLD
jgi:polar amino acid transport system substrate-binding protein